MQLLSGHFCINIAQHISIEITATACECMAVWLVICFSVSKKVLCSKRIFVLTKAQFLKADKQKIYLLRNKMNGHQFYIVAV